MQVRFQSLLICQIDLITGQGHHFFLTKMEMFGSPKKFQKDQLFFLIHIESTKPDVVLMDIDMPFVNGIEGVAIIRTKYPDLKTLMQTVFEDDEKVFAAICAGADGYILKQSNPLKLIEAISEVLEGGAPMTPVVARKVLQLFNKQNRPTVKRSSTYPKGSLKFLIYLLKDIVIR